MRDAAARKVPDPARELAEVRSLEILPEYHIDTECAGVVAQGDHRDVAPHGIFNLDDLLLGAAHVCDIGHGEIGREMLLDGPAGGGALAASRADAKKRINAEMADAKHPLDAAAHL